MGRNLVRAKRVWSFRVMMKCSCWNYHLRWELSNKASRWHLFSIDLTTKNIIDNFFYNEFTFCIKKFTDLERYEIVSRCIMLLFGHTKYFSSNLLPPLARCLGSAVWCVRITLRNEKNFFVCLCKRRKRAINWLRNNFSPRLKLFSFFRKIFSLFFFGATYKRRFRCEKSEQEQIWAVSSESYCYFWLCRSAVQISV